EEEFARTMDLQTAGLKKAAILFSGGVDSSLIAKAVLDRVPKTTAFVAGVEGSHDLGVAKKSASQLGIDLISLEMSEKDVQKSALECVGILTFFDSMQIGIAVPALACCQKISNAGHKVVFSGQGSDEIFCGYSSYVNALSSGGYPAVEEELWNAVSRMWSRNFFRDDAIASSCSLELRVPFMAKDFLAAAMSIPAQKKILSASDDLRKHPIRALAISHGVPKEIAMQKKKAMQYGSGSQKIVNRLFKG
ncbi:MAG: asparagine synthase C-terminal domain-containing protein, partial [archaeon]|nr:asparagine synthase C-terminal domain-containing protein [archaeon]